MLYQYELLLKVYLISQKLSLFNLFMKIYLDGIYDHLKMNYYSTLSNSALNLESCLKEEYKSTIIYKSLFNVTAPHLNVKN